MDALILAAGYSRRLEPLTLARAKPLLPVGGRPMVDYVLEKVERVPGLARTFLVTNDKFYADFAVWGRDHPRVLLVNDGTRSYEGRLGAIGDMEIVVRAQAVSSDLLVVAGDNLFDAELAAFAADARTRAPRVSVGVVEIHDRALIRGRYGVVVLGPDGRVTDFAEKPEEPKTHLVSTGIYYFPQSALTCLAAYLQGGENPDNVGYLIRSLVSSLGVCGVRLPGRWYDIGDMASYELADRTFAPQGRVSAEGEI